MVNLVLPNKWQTWSYHTNDKVGHRTNEKVGLTKQVIHLVMYYTHSKSGRKQMIDLVFTNGSSGHTKQMINLVFNKKKNLVFYHTNANICLAKQLVHFGIFNLPRIASARNTTVSSRIRLGPCRPSIIPRPSNVGCPLAKQRPIV